MSLQTKDILNACKRRPLLCVCIALGLALLLVFYFRKDALGANQTALEERSKLLRKLKANATYAAHLDQHIKSLREINQAIGAQAMREGELAINQQLFLRLESETGVKLIDLRPQGTPAPAKGAKAGGYVPMAFSLTIEGEYRQLIVFLKRLEQGPTLGRIVSASTGSSENAVLSISLNVELLGIRR